jgi:hypothetical protein
VAIPGMNTTSRPATPDQVRLLIGLSSLMGLPMVAVVMIYVTVNQATPDHGPAWRAFVLALAVGAIVGLVFARFFPLFGGTSPKLAAVRTALPFTPIVAFVVVEVVGRVLHQSVPVTTGFLAGVDAVLATILLISSLRALSESTTRSR